MTWRALVLFVCAMAWPLPAAANEDVVQVTLAAPEACPSRAALLASAGKRAPMLRLTSARASVAVHVAISQRSGGYAATLILETARSRDERSLRATTCSELVEAAGLLIAVLVRSERAEQPGEEAPAAAEAPEAVKFIAQPVAETPPPAPSSPAAPPAPRWSPFVGAALQSEVAVLPDVASGGALFAGVERSWGLLAPAVRLAGSVVTSDLAAGPSRLGSFFRAAGRAEGCPLRVALTSSLTLRPCAWLGLGVVHAAGAAVAKARSQTEAWADAGALVRLRAASARLFLELDVGVVTPLTRPVFLLENPRSVVYETPPVGALLALGGGVRFL